MLTRIPTAATLLRIVILLQLAFAYGLHRVFAQNFPSLLTSDKPQLSFVLFCLSMIFFFMLIRMTIVVLQFLIGVIWGSPTPREFQLTPFQTLKMIWGETTASLSAFTWRMPFRSEVALSQPSAHGQTNKPIPVLLIHGYGCNRAMWLKFSEGLAQKGFQSAALNLEPPLGSIYDYVPSIEKELQSLLQTTQSTHCAIIAHSMGGLATRAFLANSSPKKNQRVLAVITLGTPHQGTVHAALGQGENTKQMRRRSLWREQLAQRERKEDLAKFACILSHHDNIVAPQSDQFVPHAKVIELHGIGHVSLAYSDQVVEIASAEIVSRLAGKV